MIRSGYVPQSPDADVIDNSAPRLLSPRGLRAVVVIAIALTAVVASGIAYIHPTLTIANDNSPSLH